MKKLFVSATLIMGLGASVLSANTAMTEEQVSIMVNEFTPIDIQKLPRAVKTSIAISYPTSTIKEAAVEVKPMGPKNYKVVLTDADNNESTLFYEENGREIKQ